MTVLHCTLVMRPSGVRVLRLNALMPWHSGKGSVFRIRQDIQCSKHKTNDLMKVEARCRVAEYRLLHVFNSYTPLTTVTGEAT